MMVMNTTVIAILILGAVIARVIANKKAEVKPTTKQEMVSFLGNVTINFAFYIALTIIFG
jgi:hypothetical protein